MLTPDQLRQRQGKLTASRIACLMTSDAVAIDRLYREMIGEAEPEDLSHVWPVRLGEVTEKLNLDWFEQNYGPLQKRGEVVVHPEFKWAAATLDAWFPNEPCPVEVKHVGGREPLEIIIDRYQPQMQWQMAVTRAQTCALSVIFGANEPVVEFIPADAEYQKEMCERGAAFMLCVETRAPPVELPPIPPPIIPTKKISMDGNNHWATNAIQWTTTRQAAVDNKEAEKCLKSAVPDDAKECFGYGVTIKRDRAGRMSLREISE